MCFNWKIPLVNSFFWNSLKIKDRNCGTSILVFRYQSINTGVSISGSVSILFIYYFTEEISTLTIVSAIFIILILMHNQTIKSKVIVILIESRISNKILLTLMTWKSLDACMRNKQIIYKNMKQWPIRRSSLPIRRA